MTLKLPIDRSEYGSAWADSLASLLVRLHETQGGNPQHTLRIAGLTRDICMALDSGHSCLDKPHLEKIAFYRSPIIVPAHQALQRVAPLVLEQNRLYLYRYWFDEYQLAQAIQQLNRTIPVALNREQINLICHKTHSAQQQAIEVALAQGLTIITGGPGTGKTFTLVRILMALLQQNPQLKVALAAPTGKAAARMQEALRNSLEQTPLAADLLSVLPNTAFTLHRLLGMGHGTQAKFNQQQPLAYDLVIVDEASMIDLRMATQLLSAIAPTARLILLGDANQLAAVEAGAVLAEISKAKRLSQSSVQLTESQRFGSDSGIGQLATAICDGDIEKTQELLKRGLSDVLYHPLEIPDALAQKLFKPYLPLVVALKNQQAITDILKAFDQYRVLCALREGNYGVFSINQRLSVLLQRALLLAEDSSHVWFHGRPVMVTQNDYTLGVFNGDIGITLEEDDGFYVYFPARDGEPMRVSAARLAHSETALALTIHKSQGSEFKQVAVVLPKEDTPILTRELLYTGITRAKSVVSIWGMTSLIEKAVQRKTQRASGLQAKLDQTLGEIVYETEMDSFE
ncbi:MAG: exodeoxyribonuclease V subunit alpha [Agitococcus sp.]|nr:exodeoxyribonuclease V subunit alpha [Agitococcus sp.]